MQLKFNCPRTCRTCEQVDACRFMPVLEKIIRPVGSEVVTSHTRVVDLQIKNPEAFGEAIENLGGKVVGHGTHKLWGRNREEGFAVIPKGWGFPAVVKEDGKVAYEPMGCPKSSLDSAMGEYAITQAEMEAANQGWYCERVEDGTLRIDHPSGGQIFVNPAGEMETEGFMGMGCHDAASPIAIAMGETAEIMNKPEANMQQAQIHVQE